jgi:hypothetical protein
MKNLMISFVVLFLVSNCNDPIFYKKNKDISLINPLDNPKENIDSFGINSFLERIERLNKMTSYINDIINKLEALKKPFENLPKIPFSTPSLTPSKSITNVDLGADSTLNPINQLQNSISNLENLKKELDETMIQINSFLSIVENVNGILNKIPPQYIFTFISLSKKALNLSIKIYYTLNDAYNFLNTNKNQGLILIQENINFIKNKINPFNYSFFNK